MENKHQKRILITGAGGFFGRELVKQALAYGKYDVIGISSQGESLKSQFKMYKQFKVLKSLIELDKNIDDNKDTILVNCAFPRSSDPTQLSEGILYTERTVETAISKGVSSIINISSQSVYSQKAKEPAKESTVARPESLYGMAKYASERVVSTLCSSSKNKVDFANIRLASLSGVGLDVRMINKFIKYALNGNPLTINGGNQYISYLEVTDAASAIIKMINTDSSLWKPVYNLGNNDYCTILELAKNIKKISKERLGKDVKLEIHEGQGNFSNLINSEEFYKDFNWRPHYTMISMMKKIFNYYN